MKIIIRLCFIHIIESLIEGDKLWEQVQQLFSVLTAELKALNGLDAAPIAEAGTL